MAVKIHRKILVDSSPRGGTQTNSYIVIHNTAGGTASSCKDWFNQCLHGQGRDGVATHYTIDDKEGYQMLEDNWGAAHCGSGNAHYASWGNGVKGANNSNCLGIEVADGSSVNAAVAIENCIELVRYLMQAYSIPISNVIRHGDVQNKACPATIMKLGKWDYMLQEIEARNKANDPINLDISELSKADMVASTGGGGSTGSGGQLNLTFNDTTTVQESLPNANTSDNWVDMHEIKGITLHFYPPYHNCIADSMTEYFKSLGWNRNFHYKVDKDTQIDFDKKPVSGQTTGGNIVGTSKPDFEVTAKDPLYNEVVIGGGGSGSTDDATAGTPIEGNDIATKVYNYCVQQGCSCAAACGIVGNCEQESSLSPTAKNKSSGAYGLFQWLGGRYKSLQKKASAAGVDISDPDVQIKHMWAELTGEDSTTLSILKRDYGGIEGFKKISDPQKAALAFCESFERPGPNGGQAKKKQFAQKWYDLFSKSQPASSSADITTIDEQIEQSQPFGWPVPNESGVQSCYGYRTDAFGYNYHHGIDISTVEGSGVYCYANGKVEKVYTDTKLEGYVRISHVNGLHTIYGSLLNDSIFVEEGQEVEAGQCIGLSGTTSANGLMHVHFEMMINGENIDPLVYVNPYGGNKTIPDAYYGIASADITDANDNVTWDNIDKGKICFASADNNTHTYIDSNLFNNQHPKYTLSIGAFFYDEFDLVEKTGTVDWPATENKLIQQCAKALYDEGFTSTQLWREFDLNRAPSPFLYLDKNKWRAFCEEVDKQVEWLNNKYGKVTATYVPNELLQDSNNNKFMETAPSGGSQDGNNNNSIINLNLNGSLFIGDGWTVAIKDQAEADGVSIEAVGGKTFNYFYSGTADRLKSMKSDPTFIYIFLGINSMKSNLESDKADKFFERVKQLWPDTPVYVGKVIHLGKAWSGHKNNEYKTIEAWNEACDKFNEKLSNICSNYGFNVVSIDSGLLDSKGLLDSTKTSDGIHLKDPSLYYNNIKSALNITSGGEDSSNINGSMSSIKPTVSETEYGTVYEYPDFDPMTGELVIPSETEDKVYNNGIMLLNADKNNVDKYCYVANTTDDIKLYKEAKETTDKVEAGLVPGDELKITDVKNAFYKCTFNDKSGYVKENQVVVIENGHGKADPGLVKSNCWILYDGTELYEDSDLKKSITDLNEQDQCVILDSNKENGVYKLKTPEGDGWVKAYAITFDVSVFRTAIDTTNTLVDSANTTAEQTTTSIIDNGDFEDGESNWNNEGDIEFEIVSNAEWGKEGHYPYRGKKYARIRNINDSLAGIRYEFEVNKPENNTAEYLRILFYIKPVTQEDFSNAPTNVDTLKSNGIYVKLLDNNNKIKHEQKINIDNISNNMWTRVGCVVNNCTLDKYVLLIANDKKFDLLIDDVVVENVSSSLKDSVIGDSDSTSGIISPGAGATSIDNGGVMVYNVGSPSNRLATQPAIKTIITQEEYEKIMEYSVSAKIDYYTNSFEPDDKDLEEAKMVGVKSDSRLEILTEELKTLTDNMIRYKVIETGPGSVDHCVKPVDELNVLFKNVECKVDPIYPDLIVPPKYTTSTNDMMSKNSIPMTTVENASIELEDVLDKSFSYEYDLLAEMNKRSSGKPINYMDPFPYDDKIADLENHSPKVLIDEIESRLYSCNHPGCPIAHPMAKNFAMLNDMAINQSKLTEQRLVRLENTLSTMTRYLGRMASRVNINCVYYGGQTVLGKYKCIRCLRDDRVHDGATVTIDQCLTCTRYEPIVGQVYDILDETGFNGSAILDDMQMSYMNLDDMKNLNQVELRSTEYSYVDCNKKVENKPKSLIDEWQEADKNTAIEKIKKDITNVEQQEEAIKALQPSDYLFMMDWTEQNVDLQRPDIKVYPTEKIAAKYYNQAGDEEEVAAPAEESTQIGTDDEVYESIASGEWVDTREIDDSIQANKYTSLDFYFENFNINRTGYEYDNGLQGNIGLSYTGGSIGTDVNGNGAEIRKKITEMALIIVEEHKNGQAVYSQSPRTVDHEQPKRISGTKCGMKNPIGYDCTSFVSCCYKHAGLSDFYSGTTGQGSIASNTLLQEVLKKGGKIWFADTEGMSQALPGDVLMSWKSKLDKNKIADGSGAKASHAMIYMGDGMIAHSSRTAAPPNGIRYEKADYYITGSYAGHAYFLRPQSLVDADAAATSSSSGGSSIEEKAGTIDGVSYVMALKGSKCTQYKEGEGGYKDALGKSLNSSKCNTVASHNLPYGTKVYIPAFKNKQTVNPSCIFTVTDTGNAGFDFDICCSPSVWSGSTRFDVYVTEWGTGKVSPSQTYAYKNFPVYESLWKDYVKNGGTTYKVTKFNNEDANITSKDFWKKYS